MWWTIVKEAAVNWSDHKDARQGAALAYYSVFSLGPIIVIAIAVASLLFGNDAVTSQVMSSIKGMLGETGAQAVEAMLAGASRPAAGILALGSLSIGLSFGPVRADPIDEFLIARVLIKRPAARPMSHRESRLGADNLRAALSD